MTQYTHTIGRQVTNSLPAWRTAMTSTNTVYAVGENASVLTSRIQWPGGVDPATLGGGAEILEYSGLDNQAWYGAVGYGGSVYVPEIGAHGAMVLGITGEHAITEQLNIWGISEDSPTWNFFQHPLYATSSAQADTYNADAYFNVADYNACVSAGRYITYGNPDTVNWDRTTFPVGFGNAWVLRRKYGANAGSTLLGNNRPHWFRYSMPCYVPASMTGTGAGAIITNSHGTIYGPFNSGSIPPGESYGTYYAEMWDATKRKYWCHALDVQTRAWQRLPNPIPQAVPDQFSIAHAQAGVDVERKRIYYTSTGGAWRIFHLDLTSGLSGATFSALTDLTLVGGDLQTMYNNILCIPSSGPLAGKRLWYFQSNDNMLVLLDIDGATIRKMSVSGLPTGSWRFGWDSATQRVYVTVLSTSTGTISCYRFPIPTNYTNAASYSVEALTISMGSVSAVTNPGQLTPYGQKSMYLESLGVILVPQRTGPMLAFRPG